MTEENKCDMCKGLDPRCTYCNGTGEWNQAAQSYVNNHICQCIAWDRMNCPVCKKPCHHDTPNTPKQTIDSGYGGISSTKTYKQDSGTVKEVPA